MDESTPDVPTSSDSQGSGDGNDLLCASAESVSVGGVAPEVGDNVSAKVEGTVDSVEGDHVYIKVDKVNGQDVPQDSPDESTQDSGNDESALLSKAAAADSQSYA